MPDLASLRDHNLVARRSDFVAIIRCSGQSMCLAVRAGRPQDSRRDGGATITLSTRQATRPHCGAFGRFGTPGTTPAKFRQGADGSFGPEVLFRQTEAAVLERYMGKEGYGGFRRFHKVD